MHGNGTQAGNGTEMGSVLAIFAPAQLSRKTDKKLFVGSIKANIGHGGAASEVSVLIKVLLMMQHDTIPPHIGIERQINKSFPDLTARNVHIAFEPMLFQRPTSGTRL